MVLVFAGGFYLGLQQKTENVAVVGFDPGQFDEGKKFDLTHGEIVCPKWVEILIPKMKIKRNLQSLIKEALKKHVA